MKKIFNILIVIAVLTGCKKDLLDTEPYGSIASSNMWTTDNLTDLGVTGVYAALNSSTVAGRDLYQMDQYSYTGQTRDVQSLMAGTITPGNGLFSGNWRGLYEGIQRANDAIKNLPTSPSANEKKARYIAECKFLRAYFYFRLNQLWKGVPIYLEPFTDTEATKGRSTEEEVWNQIIADLNDCIAEPNLPQKYTKGNANFGHITKGAAYALRGKAYLYQKKWILASADFSKVKEAGYTLFSDYKSLFKEANEQSDEMIFTIQNISLAGFGSSTQWYCGTRSSFGSCWNTYLVSPNLVDLYDNADGTLFNWEQVIPGYSAMSPAKREVFFLRNNLSAAEITAATARGAEMSLYLPQGNEERIKAAYANRDGRLAANVITPYSIYNGVNGATNSAVTSRWPYRSDALTTADLRSDTQSLFYYLYRKFVYEGNSEIIDRNYGPIDFPIIRYADVLLMWAEAINEQGFNQEAVNLVNLVRARGGVAPLQSFDPTAPAYVADQITMRERIRNERRIEFPNEGINYFDELRWMTLKEKSFKSGNGVKQVWGANVSSYDYMGDQLYNWPIPQVEIEMNSNLKQNPGWAN
ncbi:RagB/SusD family nutrient uptake outer membrane protein [Pedobacter ginsengisoli]|uniref:RagB/SusD family nutrient uptake outer membrane protein n=1 Tax=Pedobacter ginsengisoli TaxID=363852 RepID=A0A2D1U8H2_9SPHI|nr:RagB/SusD family nutrient uptake outer membrane protein [Pedobacter ginsengisoli]ATP57896.1 RagB/SusD family nutrient uptake outer membrane protein [Pedobacter ginsengisoli]